MVETRDLQSSLDGLAEPRHFTVHDDEYGKFSSRVAVDVAALAITVSVVIKGPVDLANVDFFSLGIIDQKPSHLLEEEEHGSPPAAKKRRTNSASFPDDSIDHALSRSDQHGPNGENEKELATMLDKSVVDAPGPTDGMQGNSGQQNDSSENAVNGSSNADSTSADVALMISKIMDHTERQEQTVAMGPQEIPASGDFPGARGYPFLKANSNLKIQSLPILDNLVCHRIILKVVSVN